MSDYNFAEGPGKIFVDRFDTITPGGLMYVSLKSGKDRYEFVLEPVLAKKLAKVVSQFVENIEKQMGVSIDDRLDNEPILSPLTDINKDK